MLNEIIGMYLSDKYKILTDRITFAQSIDASDTTTFSLTDANNGVKLKADLATNNYFATKYTIWSQNGILDVTIKPDDESINQTKILAFTKQTESPFIPPKYIEADLTLSVTNNQVIEDDLFLIIEILKVPQGKVNELIDIGKVLCTAPDNIDIQTLGIEKYIIYSNELLKALLLANGGELPGIPKEAGTLPSSKEPAPTAKACRRS